MGNRCSRYWGRKFVDLFAIWIAFPLATEMVLLQHQYETEILEGQRSHSEHYYFKRFHANVRPIIVILGFLRAILPFALSFQGSRIGRQGVSSR